MLLGVPWGGPRLERFLGNANARPWKVEGRRGFFQVDALQGGCETWPRWRPHMRFGQMTGSPWFTWEGHGGDSLNVPRHLDVRKSLVSPLGW